MKFLLLIISIFALANVCCTQSTVKDVEKKYPSVYQTRNYLSLLKGRRVALLVNQTSAIENIHIVDTLISLGINVVKIFAPEHGFRGKHDAGEHVKNEFDKVTGVPIISLYGKNKKPSQDHLKNVDVVVFDIQDVGVRFFTYISSMHYMMEACAISQKQFVVLDRPNPNGDYFDGPVLNKNFKSFVGMHPIPVVHGLTVGELAKMINGEGWLENGVKCELDVIKMQNYTHNTIYKLPIKPSPNLPNYTSIRLYPSLCFFEATNMSIGRGTHFPFQVIGFPDKTGGDFIFTPISIDGMAKNPKQKDVECYGKDLRNTSEKHQFSLSYFIEYYNKFRYNEKFELNERWFNLLAGNDILLHNIKMGNSEMEIKKVWENDLDEYSKLRDKYLLYPK